MTNVPDPQPPAPEASVVDTDTAVATISGAFRYPLGIQHHPGCDSRVGKECDCYLKSQLPAEQALHALAARLREAERERDEQFSGRVQANRRARGAEASVPSMTDREKARDLGNQSAALARSIADVLNDALDALEAAEARVRELEAALRLIEGFIVERHIEGDTSYQPALIARRALLGSGEGQELTDSDGIGTADTSRNRHDGNYP